MLVGDILQGAVERDAAATAVVTPTRTLDYAQLFEESGRLAAGLSTLVPAGGRVAIMSRNCAEYITTIFGVPMGGMSTVFVNQRLGPREVEYILADSGATVLLVESEYLPLVDRIRSSLPDLTTVVSIDGAHAAADMSYEALIGISDTATERKVEADDVAWLIYSSGTTGRPKGVMLTHRNLAATTAQGLIGVGYRRGAGYLMPFPLCHAAAHMELAIASVNASIFLTPSFDARDFLETLGDPRVKAALFAPSMMAMILERDDLDDFETSGIEQMLYGSSAISPQLLGRAMEIFPSAELVGTFGMTELAGSPIMLNGDDHRRAMAGRQDLLASCGRPLPMARVLIVDRHRNPLPAGQVGEIAVRGEQVMKGYWNNAEATAERVQDGWMYTGDVGKMDDEGYVYIVDRITDMIVTGGENVYSREVEEMLATHPGILEAAVIGVPSEIWGEDVCAIVVPNGKVPDLTESEVIGYAKANLASFKKPKSVHFVEELPRNLTGKIQKFRLRESYAEASDRITLGN